MGLKQPHASVSPHPGPLPEGEGECARDAYPVVGLGGRGATRA